MIKGDGDVGDVLVGRDEAVRVFGDEVRNADGARLAQLIGASGAGRTALLRRFQTALGADAAPKGVYLDLSDYDPGHPGQVGAKASVGAVQASFKKLSLLLSDVMRQVADEPAAKEIVDAANRARRSDVMAGRVGDLHMSLEELQRPFAPQDLADAWRNAARTLVDAFAALWASRVGTGGGRPVILLDNYDLVAQQELGEWLGWLVHAPGEREDEGWRSGSPLGDAFTVVSSTTTIQGWVELGPSLSWDAENLSDSEVRDYIQLVHRKVPPDQVAIKVFGLTFGHPATLRVVGDLVWGRNGSVSATHLLDGLDAYGDEMAAELVERSLAAAKQEWLVDAVRAAAVARTFDAELLGALLGATRTGAVDAAPPADVLPFSVLTALPFVEKVDEKRARINKFVRTSLLVRLRVNAPDWLRSLHEVAEAHYQSARRQKFPEENDAVRQYGHWFLIEDPTWQHLKREWLHHAAHVGRARRAEIVLETARLYVDAFWWWGNYVHYDWCDDLLADLTDLLNRAIPVGGGKEAQARARAEWRSALLLQKGLEALQHHYPLRSQKPVDADWPAVARALKTIESACGLDLPTDDPSEKQQHVAALIHLYKAHTWRYRAPDETDPMAYYNRAVQTYEKADALLEAVGEDDLWIRGWVAYERADMLVALVRAQERPLEGEERHRALSLARVAAVSVQPSIVGGRAAPGQSDHELMSNLHRLRADIDRHDGRSHESAVWFGRAVRHAYLAQVDGKAPDEYTMQFYIDIRAQAIDLVRSSWLRGEHEMAVECARLMWRHARVLPSTAAGPPVPITPEQPAASLEQLVADAAQGTPIPLATTLFFEGPDFDDLGDDLTDFAERVREFADDPDLEADDLREAFPSA